MGLSFNGQLAPERLTMQQEIVDILEGTVIGLTF